jgi:hypothetical protein
MTPGRGAREGNVNRRPGLGITLLAISLDDRSFAPAEARISFPCWDDGVQGGCDAAVRARAASA